jgi:uncharacterized protein YdaU (DUF1376 family)
MPKPIFTGRPWYPLYVRSMLDSERVENLTLAEEGAYRRALDIEWWEGSLPADPKRLAEKIGKDCTVEIAKNILQFFSAQRRKPNRIVNSTLENIRRKQSAINRQQTDRAKHAADQRWRKHKKPQEIEASSSNAPSNAQGNAPAMLGSCKVERELNININKKKGEREERETSNANASPPEENSLDSLAHSLARPRSKKINFLDEKENTFLEQLKQDPEYMHCDITEELAKAKDWTAEHGIKLTEPFFVGWLDRIHKPIPGVENVRSYQDHLNDIRARVAQRDQAAVPRKNDPDS